jgi:2'-5' RNA ligase
MDERLRLFVAVDLPEDARVQLAGWADGAAPPAVRRVPAENLHVTLAFLGSRSAEEADVVAALLPVVAAPVGELRTAGALWLPPRRPGVLTVALEDSAPLATLHGSLSTALADAVGYEPEHRRFRPHVTVGRVRRGTRVRTEELPPPPALTFGADGLTLYRSHTGGGGARYEALEQVTLG